MQTMYQTTKYSPSSSLMPQRSASQAGEPWASASPAAGPTYSAGSPGTSGGGGSGSAAKQRLRWTPELHERFVDAVTQLGGPDREFSLFQLQPFMERSFDCIAPTLLIVSSSVPSSLCLVESLAALSQIVEFFFADILKSSVQWQGRPQKVCCGSWVCKVLPFTMWRVTCRQVNWIPFYSCVLPHSLLFIGFCCYWVSVVELCLIWASQQVLSFFFDKWEKIYVQSPYNFWPCFSLLYPAEVPVGKVHSWLFVRWYYIFSSFRMVFFWFSSVLPTFSKHFQYPPRWSPWWRILQKKIFGLSAISKKCKWANGCQCFLLFFGTHPPTHLQGFVEWWLWDWWCFMIYRRNFW